MAVRMGMAHSFPASQDGFKGGFQQEASVGPEHTGAGTATGLRPAPRQRMARKSAIRAASSAGTTESGSRGPESVASASRAATSDA